MSGELRVGVLGVAHYTRCSNMAPYKTRPELQHIFSARRRRVFEMHFARNVDWTTRLNPSNACSRVYPVPTPPGILLGRHS